jgi:hypothetical protein
MEFLRSIPELDRIEHSSFFEGNYLEDFKTLLLACWLLSGFHLAAPPSVDGWPVACHCHREHVAFGIFRRCLFFGPGVQRVGCNAECVTVEHHPTGG